MKNILLTILTILLPVAKLVAQVPPPPEYGEDSTPGAPSGVPIDNYTILLVAVALILSAYYIMRQRQIAKA